MIITEKEQQQALEIQKYRHLAEKTLAERDQLARHVRELQVSDTEIMKIIMILCILIEHK